MPPSADVVIKDDGRRLTLGAAGRERDFAALWLRERAPDAATLDPQTGQRLIEAALLPLDIAVTAAHIDAAALELHFSDGHHTRFSLDTLFADAPPPASVADGLALWDATLESLPGADFAAALDDDAALLAMLEDLERHGFVKVAGVPVSEDGMQPLIDRIGPLRRTNWGGIADVKSVAEAYDLTMTQRGLEPHTDNPYRDPIPGYIWLHCLSNAADGGDSTLVDGFMAALRLREEAPEHFACLTELPSTFRYTDATTDLESEGPLIELDGDGRLARVRYSNRTERIPAHDPELLTRYYAARQHFYRLITDPALTVHLKLAPGEMLIMDNYRLLHGRTPFQLEGGVRHLRQGYVDRDSTASRRRVLRARHAPDASVTRQGATS
ncbi:MULTISPECIES: TauD/TfdA family dioxygenase [Modicisalibacter]|uniref:2-trimethylaminoethylphosphonate dioxygenase n=1 Tax=Modicisalibacter TaxID=574347 RepID=UPI00100B1D80|nr:MULTISPECIES: TauD/TfdA family dioxygenase [Halomonadaceae]MBZ9557279.1 TauD/TfdA family dioxygenase [Modicisalibacter sp. R2A 31.J]MBZ9574007.1 TauD/TfdA family dioxygenase [Modicisalibacter sp. MOD 31.J]